MQGGNHDNSDLSLSDYGTFISTGRCSMNKENKYLRTVQNEPGRFILWCPGCECGHSVFIAPHVGGVHWTFNGDFEKPTFSPSLLVDKNHADRRCHFFIVNGNIQYLDDCSHGLKGKTIPMERF